MTGEIIFYRSVIIDEEEENLGLGWKHWMFPALRENNPEGIPEVFRPLCCGAVSLANKRTHAEGSECCC